MSPSERQEEEAVPLAAPRTGAFEQEWLLLDPGHEEEDEQHHRPPMWTWALLVAAVRPPPPPPPACRRSCQLAAAVTGLCVLHRPTAVGCMPSSRAPQVLSVSSAAVVFAMMSDVPPITLAAWRLQLTSVLLGVGAAVQLCGMPPDDRRRVVQSVSLGSLAGSAATAAAAACCPFGACLTVVHELPTAGRKHLHMTGPCCFRLHPP